SAGNENLAKSIYIKFRAEEILSLDRAEQSRIAGEKQQEQAKITKEQRTAAIQHVIRPTKSVIAFAFGIMCAVFAVLSALALIVAFGFTAKGFAGMFICILLVGVVGYLTWQCVKKS